MSVVDNNFIGLRVGYLDYTGTPCSGTVVFQKPHNREPEIVWFGILNDNPDLKPALAQKILTHEGEALLSKQLVVLDPDLKMAFSLDDYRVHSPDKEKLSALFAHYEFKNLLDFLQAPRPVAPVAAPAAQADLKISEVLDRAQRQGRLFVHTQEELLAAITTRLENHM